MLQGRSLVTASDRVLLGTVREVLLEVAASHGVPVQLRPPTFVELLCGCGAVSEPPSGVRPMSSAFICSTSRIVLPIARLALPNELFVAHTPAAARLNEARCVASLR